ncbi:hypothetical protein [Streptococcus sp. sy004]|uniref:hypothetical protein n=1 Tax=Streptococcus sp. sy004 TaxID=2600149 RepID=UPI0011B4357C|nr:hypothetical protein [Streptococcus sp. sy004]TWT12109.1 hypothetical protein FRX54_00850 [Streptococcus sp. sy004]
MNKQLLHLIKRGSIFYLFLVVIDLLIELFQITKSGTIITLFGVKIISKITPNELNTTFLLHDRLLISYLVTMLAFLLGAYFVNKKKFSSP